MTQPEKADSGSQHLAAQVLEEMSKDGSPGKTSQRASEFILALLNLASAMALSAEAGRALSDLDESYRELVSAGREPWKEPELFLALHAFLWGDALSDPTALEAIRFHLECELEPPARWRRSFLRSPVLRGEVYRYDRVRSATIRLPRLRKGGPIVIPATAKLFADMLDESVYPNVDVEADESLSSRLDCAFNLIDQFRADLLLEILRTVSVIALVGDFGRPGFSCRTRYYGGIFINPGYENGNALAETIIHEYLHLKLWLLWISEPVASRAKLEVVINSPVTGRSRQAGVMLQAYLIYAQCVEFYAWAVHNRVFGNEAWARRRLNWLVERMPALRDNLISVFSQEQTAMLMIQAIDERMHSYSAV